MTAFSILSFKRLDWVAISFALIAFVLGVAIAIAVQQIGALALLAVPALLLFLATVAQPDIGLAGLMFVTVTQLSNVGIVFHGLPSIAQPLAGLLIMLIVLRIVLYGEQPVGWMRAAPILVLYVLLWLISMLHASDFEIALNTFIGFIKDVLGCVIIVFLIQKPRSLQTAFWTLIAAGIFMGAITAYQGLTSSYANDFWGFGQLTAQTSGDVTNQRISGPYSNPNAYAQLLVVILPIALDRVWHERRMLLRLLAGLAAVLIAISVFYTYSRNGFVSMVFVAGLLFAQHRSSILSWIITAALIVGVIQFLPAALLDRLGTLSEIFTTDSQTQLTDSSFRGRFSENLAAWRMFQDNPILGVGLGNFRNNYQTYSREIGLDPRRTTRTPANLYLELLSEQGLVGALLFFFLLIVVVKNAFGAAWLFNRLGMQREAYLTIALLSGFAGYMFAAINKNSAYANVFWVLIGILLAVAQVAQSTHDELEEVPYHRVEQSQ